MIIVGGSDEAADSEAVGASVGKTDNSSAIVGENVGSDDNVGSSNANVLASEPIARPSRIDGIDIKCKRNNPVFNISKIIVFFIS